MRELSCATRSSLDFLTSNFTAPQLNWLLKLTVGRGGLQNSFGGAEQPRMIELLVYNVGGQLVLGSDVLGGQLVLGPCVQGDILTGGHPVLWQQWPARLKAMIRNMSVTNCTNEA